jgi:ABC-type transport system substrate-binding protein
MSWLCPLVLIAFAASSPPETTPQAWAASAGTVVVAQGVDPTTLDPMNHQEAPATVLANNLFDGLIERDTRTLISSRSWPSRTRA